MDSNKVTQDVLALAREQGVFSDDLAASEEKLCVFIRKLGQDVQQQHLNAQGPLGYEKSSRACPCGQEQKFVGHRRKTFRTLLGPLQLRRAYYHCSQCHCGYFPFDQAQGLGTRRVSVPLAQRVVELTQDFPFGKSGKKLQSLLGCRLSKNTLRRISQEVGQAADALEQQAAVEVQADRQALPQLAQGRLYVEADGAMVHFTDGWHEVKNLVCRWQDAQGRWQQRVLCRREKVEAFTTMCQVSPKPAHFVFAYFRAPTFILTSLFRVSWAQAAGSNRGTGRALRPVPVPGGGGPGLRRPSPVPPADASGFLGPRRPHRFGEVL